MFTEDILENYEVLKTKRLVYYFGDFHFPCCSVLVDKLDAFSLVFIKVVLFFC
jgi:hypothetical protein